jgi:16S rRNA G966 N2-methylase RsmD
VGWDIVFFDPPYSSDYSTVLFEFGAESSTLLREEGIFITEHHLKNELPDAVGNLRRWRMVKQGQNCLSFYERS